MPPRRHPPSLLSSLFNREGNVQPPPPQVLSSAAVKVAPSRDLAEATLTASSPGRGTWRAVSARFSEALINDQGQVRAVAHPSPLIDELWATMDSETRARVRLLLEIARSVRYWDNANPLETWLLCLDLWKPSLQLEVRMGFLELFKARHSLFEVLLPLN